MEDVLEQIRQYVEDNQLAAALELLLKYAAPTLENDVLLLQGNLSELQSKKRTGIITYNQYSQGLIKVSGAILDLLPAIKKQAGTHPDQPNT